MGLIMYFLKDNDQLHAMYLEVKYLLILAFPKQSQIIIIAKRMYTKSTRQFDPLSPINPFSPNSDKHLISPHNITT